MEQLVELIPERAPWYFSVIAVSVLLIVFVEWLYHSRDADNQSVLHRLSIRLGLNGVPFSAVLPFLLFLALLFSGLLFGLLALLQEIFSQGFPEGKDAKAEWRFVLTKIAAFTAVLGAVVALPFTLIRLSLNRQQVDTALEALTNDKMNTAVDDLHAQRQITKWKNKIASNGWEDDITRRNGAIDRFLGLVQENETLALENLHLYNQIERLRRDPEFIENVARQELGMIGTNEIILKFQQSP